MSCMGLRWRKMPSIEVIDNIKGLREILCLAQYVGDQTPGINHSLYSRRIQDIINELDKHRPLGPDGKHGTLHTPTCGCADKGHGSWCKHECCGYSTASYYGGDCKNCGHHYTKPGEHSASCDHTACASCWSASCRRRKCLLCGHDWSDVEQNLAKVK
jgi:hypothetical protein